MPESVILTPGQRKASQLAQIAKDTPNGICVRYLTKDYFNKEAAKKAARAFQVAFSVMRKKERMKVLAVAKQFDPLVNENTFIGPYDHLGAYLREWEDRWEVQIVPEVGDLVEIYDLLTNQPIEMGSS